MNYDISPAEAITALSREWVEARWNNAPKTAAAYRRGVEAMLDGLTKVRFINGRDETVEYLTLEELPAMGKALRRTGWHWSDKHGTYVYVECCNTETCNCWSHEAIHVTLIGK